MIELKEWNGEGLPPIGCDVECFLYDYDANKHWVKRVVLGHGKYSEDHKPNSIIVDSGECQYQLVACEEYRKLETLEQKLAREMLESAYELYKKCNEIESPNCHCRNFDEFKSMNVHKTWINIVVETGYIRPE